MKKKILMIGIVFLLILTNAITIYAITGAAFSASADKTEVRPGDTFTVTANVSCEAGINAIEGFEYSYNAEQLEVVSEAVGANFMKFEEEGIVTLMYSGTEIVNTADIYTINFRVKNDVPENTTVSVSVGSSKIYDATSADISVPFSLIDVNVVGEDEGEGETLDTTAPTVQSIAVTKPGDSTAGMRAGQEIEITATFSEEITGETVPTLKINFDESNIERTITTGTIDGNTIVYKYTIVDSDNGRLTATGYNGGTIKDLAGNNAVISLKTLSGSTVIVGNQNEDTNIPAFTKTIEITSPESGKYKEGQEIKIVVTFDKEIKGETVPTLKIRFGTGKVISITEGTIKGNTIEYTYIIVEGDQGRLELIDFAGGEITDLDGYDAIIRLQTLTGNAIEADTEDSNGTVDNNENNGNNNNGGNNGTSGDNGETDDTTSDKEYYKAGIGISITLGLMLLIAGTVVIYAKYNKMKDI